MTNLKVYHIKTWDKEGNVYDGDVFDRKNTVKLQLISEDKNYKFTLVIDDGKELIFFKRIIKEFLTNSLENVIYFLGYKYLGHKFLISINSITGETRIENVSN